MITELKDNQVFVFGSNLAGKHFGGAARQAEEQFGAEMGIGEGLTGQCYAFPTLTKEFKQRDHIALQVSVDKLRNCAIDNPEKEFLLTKVGTGIAGYNESYIDTLFQNLPKNIIKV